MLLNELGYVVLPMRDRIFGGGGGGRGCFIGFGGGVVLTKPFPDQVLWAFALLDGATIQGRVNVGR